MIQTECSRTALRFSAAVCAALAAPVLAAAGGFCDVVFRDVARQAAIVLLAEYRQPADGEPLLFVIEVAKGQSDRRSLSLGPHGLDVFRPRHGDRFLLALTPQHTLVKVVGGMGFCTPINVLPLKGDRVGARRRVDYDGSRGSLTLDELRRDLAAPDE